MASTPELSLDTKWGGAKSFFSSEGLFLLKMAGTGDAFISSFGAIHEVKMKGEPFTIDTGHMVAFTEGLDYRKKSRRSQINYIQRGRACSRISGDWYSLFTDKKHELIPCVADTVPAKEWIVSFSSKILKRKEQRTQNELKRNQEFKVRISSYKFVVYL